MNRQTVLRMEGTFDLTEAQRVLARIAAQRVSAGVVVDVSRARELHDAAVALLARAVAREQGRVELRGLRRHHHRMLRYLGLEEALRAVGPAERRALVTDLDLGRLRALIELGGGDVDTRAAAHLETELVRALVVPQRQVSPEVVTMNSRLLVDDEERGARRELVLVYPPGADDESGRISVLTRLGTALLGLSAGEAIDDPGADAASLRIVSVPYQPEAAGDYDL